MKDCQQCGKPFENRKHPNQKYCSLNCRDTARYAQVELFCSWCKTSVKRHRYRAHSFQQTYCSKECERNWKRANSELAQTLPEEYIETGIVHCETCGASIERCPTHIRERNFCSPACFDIWRSANMSGENSFSWRGGHTDYRGPNWNRQRQKALHRDNHTCQRCGETSNLQVHHITPYQLFASYQEANELSNLVTLCMKCHTSADWEYRRLHPELERLLPDSRNIKICQNCGEPFEAKGARALRCEKCWLRTCEHCGKQFRPRLWNDVNKFCSRKCGASKRVLSLLEKPQP